MSDKDPKPKKKGSIFSFFKKSGRKRNPYGGDDFIHVEPKLGELESESSEPDERIQDLHGDQACNTFQSNFTQILSNYL